MAGLMPEIVTFSDRFGKSDIRPDYFSAVFSFHGKLLCAKNK